MYGQRFPLRLNCIVLKNCVSPAIMYGSKVWCLRENEFGIFQRTERRMVGSMCEVHLNDRKRPTDLMLILGLN